MNPETLSRCILAGLLCLLFATLGGGCVSAPPHVSGPESPLVGRIFDTKSSTFIDRDSLFQRAAASTFVILGETHDNPVHQRLQREILEAVVRAGRRPALALEQIDSEYQAALDAARNAGERDAEGLANAGRIDRKGWRWPEYKPLIELAVANNLPILAANFSRDAARTLMRSGRPAQGLPTASPEFLAVLERDIVSGHCGVRPPPAVLSGMIEAQRARDAKMAATLTQAGRRGAVLIAGAGHGRRDRGVPAYLPPLDQKKVLAIAFIEIDPAETAVPGELQGVYDVVWFTTRARRDDPCRTFKLS